MNVNVRFAENIRINPQFHRMGTNHGIRRLNGFFHNISQLSRLFDVSLARHINGFDKQNVSADFRPRQSGSNADMVFFFGFAITEFLNSQIFVKISRCNRNLLFFGKQNLLNRLAGYFCQFAFQVTNSGLTGIITDDVSDSVFFYLKLVFLDGHFLKGFGNQMTFGNLYFFIFGIA